MIEGLPTDVGELEIYDIKLKDIQIKELGKLLRNTIIKV